MKTDKWYYQLLQTFPTLPFELAGLPIPDVPYAMQSIEVKEFGFRLDGLMLPVTPDMNYPLLLVEAQMQPDPQLYYRLHLEFAVYLKQYQPPHDWVVVVIYPDRDTERAIPFLERFLGFNRIYWVYLAELPTGVLLVWIYCGWM